MPDCPAYAVASQAIHFTYDDGTRHTCAHIRGLDSGHSQFSRHEGRGRYEAGVGTD
jgi:hypothetical protein